MSAGVTSQPLANPSTSRGAPSEWPPETVAVHPLLMLSPRTSQNGAAAVPASTGTVTSIDVAPWCTTVTDGAAGVGAGTTAAGASAAIGPPPGAESSRS